MRRAPVALAVTFAALAVVLAAVFLRPPADVATPSPSPSPTATSSLSPTATATATATASPSPSPTPQGLYLSKRLGFAITLPPPWRRASCPYVDPTTATGTIFEHFTNVSSLDEEIGHIGTGPNDRIEVVSQVNPRRLSAVEFARTEPLPAPVPAGPSRTPESVTFAGRQGAQLTFPDYPFAYFVFVPDGDRMITIAALLNASSRTGLTPLLEVVRTFRFASAAETAALPDPTPMPAGAATPQALAQTLATAFQAKDVATLERLLPPCVSGGVQNGGGSAISRDRFIASLRTQFANGLTVTVDTSTVVVDGRFGPGVGTVRSRWNAQPPMSPQTPPPAPGSTAQNVALMLAPTAGGYYWSGTILLPPG